MAQELARPRGLYFEEFEVGQRIVTPGRTITEADIVNFAGLSGDFNSIHTDAVYAASAPTEERVAHGILGLSVASGLAVRTGILEDTVLVLREVKDWKFSLPVYLGDTIHVEIEVAATRPMPRLGGGLLELVMDVLNQGGERVMKGSWQVLVKSRPADADA